MLKRLKTLEALLDKLYQQRQQVDAQLLSVLDSQSTIAVVSAFRAVANQRPAISLEEVQKLRDSIEEQRQVSAEIAQEIAPSDEQEAAELMRELDQLEASELEALPEVPKAPLVVKKTQVERRTIEV